MNINNNRISSIDGIRGISIILVLLDHYIYYSGNNFLNPILSFFINSKNGVDLFFIISGYLITTILVKEHLQIGKINIGKFLLRRALRLLPALYFMIFVYFILFKLNYLNLTVNTWLSSIFFLRQFWGSGWETSHLWSLSVENMFYIVFPIFLNRLKILRFKLLLNSLIFLILLLPFIRLYIFSHTHFSTLNIFFRCDGLIFGSLIAFRTQLVKDNVRRKNFLLALIISATLYFVIDFFLIKISSNNLAYILKEYTSILNVFIWSLFFYFLLQLKKGILYWTINNSILIFIGVTSYSIYLWQQIFFSKNTKFHFEKDFYIFITIFIISFISYYFIESPFNKIKFKLK